MFNPSNRDADQGVGAFVWESWDNPTALRSRKRRRIHRPPTPRGCPPAPPGCLTTGAPPNCTVSCPTKPVRVPPPPPSGGVGGLHGRSVLVSTYKPNFRYGPLHRDGGGPLSAEILPRGVGNPERAGIIGPIAGRWPAMNREIVGRGSIGLTLKGRGVGQRRSSKAAQPPRGCCEWPGPDWQGGFHCCDFDDCGWFKCPSAGTITAPSQGGRAPSRGRKGR